MDEIMEVAEELKNLCGKALEMAEKDKTTDRYAYAFGVVSSQVDYLSRKLERIVKNAESKANE